MHATDDLGSQSSIVIIIDQILPGTFGTGEAFPGRSCSTRRGPRLGRLGRAHGECFGDDTVGSPAGFEDRLRDDACTISDPALVADPMCMSINTLDDTRTHDSTAPTTIDQLRPLFGQGPPNSLGRFGVQRLDAWGRTAAVSLSQFS